MSGICGIINFDGAPVDAELLRKMAGAAAYRGPDGIHYWIEGNVGMAHLALHTTPESVRERQPLVNQRGDLVLVTDARVDNREELESVLSAKGYLPDHPTDADFILAAYECWGEDCPKHLVGDFAFVIWDKANRKIFAARDQMGVRLLHYRHSAQQFQWATEARQLLVDPNFTPSYNEVLVAQDLVLLASGDLYNSYYAGIRKLGPASIISICGASSRDDIYWDFDPNNVIYYKDRKDYIEHFSDLFRQSIRSRLRSIRPVGIFMSGGIDSTSIAAVAAEEMRLSPTELSSGLEAVNWTVKDRPEYNETERSRAVAEKWEFGYREVDVTGCWPMVDFPNVAPHPDDPLMPHTYPFHEASLSTFSCGTSPRVWMNGYAGDMAIGGFNLFYYRNLLKNFRWKTLIEEIRNHQKLIGISLRDIKDWIFAPLIMEPVYHYFYQPQKNCHFPDWLDNDFIERTNLREWRSKRDPLLTVDLYRSAPQWKNPQKNLRYRSIKVVRDFRTREWYNRFMARYQAEITGPWDDIRLTQYLLAIPSEEIAQGINHKLLLRRSLEGILPDIIRERRVPRRKNATPAYMREFPREPAVLKKARSIIDSSVAGQLGWVNKKILGDIARDDGRIQQEWSYLWQYLCLEMWLQTSGKLPQEARSLL